ncbi:hypothetical protein [Cognatiluteimonas profundi]|uniref:hypothetical protein n=1 Tax=Cognatiluteimonas profundi TaxID=2594501 RepID=UPI001E295E74|nr:hypothetical protein [Lysobacter profundi]
MPLRRSLPPRLIAALLAAMSATALAAPPVGPPPSPPQRAPHQRDVPMHSDDALSDSVRRVERSTRGQVLSAERVPFDGRDVNRIKTVDEHGRVRVFMVDPSDAAPPRGQNGPTRGNDD